MRVNRCAKARDSQTTSFSSSPSPPAPIPAKKGNTVVPLAGEGAAVVDVGAGTVGGNPVHPARAAGDGALATLPELGEICTDLIKAPVSVSWLEEAGRVA